MVDDSEPRLLERLRACEDGAFSELFQSHAPAVRRLALGFAADRAEADDIVAETFFRVLQAVRRGSGPRENVRAYLFTVARRVSFEWHGARREVPVSEEELNHRVGDGPDAHGRLSEHTLISTAFTSLPERWRTVLWRTEVEGAQPAVVAPSFGLSPNATAALARRARRGLRAAYLQAHLAAGVGASQCRLVRDKLGGYTAGSVTGAEARRIRAHLRKCAACQSVQAELRDVCSSLRAHAGALVFVPPAATTVVDAASAGSTALAGAAKGLLAGGKLKTGLALASSAAVGVFGVAVGPIFEGGDAARVIGLPGGQELVIASPEAPAHSPTGPGRVSTARSAVDTARYDAQHVPSVPLGPTALPTVEQAGLGLPGGVKVEVAETELPASAGKPGRRVGPVADRDKPESRGDDPGPTSPLVTTGPGGADGQDPGHGNGNGGDPPGNSGGTGNPGVVPSTSAPQPVAHRNGLPR